MPNRSLKPCSYPNCPNLTQGGLCDTHKRQRTQRYEAERGTATERGYDARWHKVRGHKLAQDPLCERCKRQGHDRVAVLVHHKDRNPKNNQWENLESICNPCHDGEHKADRFNRSKQ